MLIWLKQRKVKKYLIEHPEIEEAMLKEMNRFSKHWIDDKDIPSFEDFLSTRELVAKHYREYETPSQTPWKKKKLIWYRRRTIQIALAAMVFISIFFSFLPVGHAVFIEICQTVVRWFDGEVNIHHGTNPDSEIIEPKTERFISLKELSTRLNKLIACNNKLSVTEGYNLEIASDSLILIRSNYLVDGYSVDVVQTIFDSNTEWNTDIAFEDGHAIDLTVKAGLRFLGYVDEDAGYAIAHLDNMSIEVFSETIDYDLMLEFLDDISMAD